jgi:hypothetical protein
MQSFSEGKHATVAESETAREKGQVNGMATSKKAVEGMLTMCSVCYYQLISFAYIDYLRLISSLKDES